MLSKIISRIRSWWNGSPAEPGANEKNRENVTARTLKDAAIGESVRVTRLSGQGAVKRRIMDMGITKGTEVYVRKVAPLGDPMELTVRGYELTIRKADAELVEIE